MKLIRYGQIGQETESDRNILDAMKYKVSLTTLISIFVLITNAFSQSRSRLSLNEGWEFHYAYDVQKIPSKLAVNMPHTWNRADEITTEKKTYERTSGIYEKRILIKKEWSNKRLFLYFEGANSVAHVFVNQKLIGKHTGGYTAFCVEITDALQYNTENLLTVQVSNAHNLEVLPLSGDFNVYGGLHRPVSLLITDKNCISPLDYASPGVYLTQRDVSEKSARVEVRTKLSLKDNSASLSLKTSILNAAKKVIAVQTKKISVNADSAIQNFTIQNPHLWNAKADPYTYTVQVELMQDNRTIDKVTQPLGLRYYKVDPDKGFFLNGKYLDLHGVCRHQDVDGKGSALTAADHEKDMSLINEIGATALRLTHYPHNEYFYDLCDKNGLIVWTEIPMVGPGGYTGAGYIKSPALEQHAREKMTELIRQNYNHPSIFFWGLFNELKMDYDDPIPFLKELNALAKKEDPDRLTTCASMQDDATFNEVSDVIAWNKYFGWYGGSAAQMAAWADDMHKKFPKKAIGISEYGAGGSIKQHQDSLKAPDPGSRFHPEEWQTYYHEKNWKALRSRPYLWGKFIWVLADFGSSIRNEGDTPGMNDKGLVTYDRSVKKDAFYFYKANWNHAPMLYISERRNDRRNRNIIYIKAYTTAPTARLYINDKFIGEKIKNELNMVVWESIELTKGVNRIKITAKMNGKAMEDSCVWTLK